MQAVSRVPGPGQSSRAGRGVPPHKEWGVGFTELEKRLYDALSILGRINASTVLSLAREGPLRVSEF